MISISSLPTVNAILNSLSAMFLVTGYLMIRRKNVALHRICMVAAFVTSVLFLISYLTYHAANPGMTRFPDIPIVRTVYLSILLTHTILAAFVPFLAIITLRFAFKQKWEQHRRIAKWTFPIWLYVSITGVIIYLMLYHLYKV